MSEFLILTSDVVLLIALILHKFMFDSRECCLIIDEMNNIDSYNNEYILFIGDIIYEEKYRGI